MPSAINSDNGVVSGTAGLKSSADSSGVLDLQTNGTTAISISASQVVSFANQPTYTGGTANGVMFLNGSKAVTTGTALTFDGSQLDIPLGSAGTPSLSTPTDPNTGMFFPAADTIAFAEGGVEAMRIDSNGNMGVGTTSPAARLDVLSSANRAALITTSSSGFYGALQIANTTGNSEASIGYRDSTDTDETSWVAGKSVNAADAFGWYYGGARMTLTSSGNFGIGTTSPSTRLHVAGSATNGAPFVTFAATATNDTFNWATTTFASNLAASNNLIHFIGQAGSSKNSAYFGFKYSSSGSNNNLLTMGLYAADNLLNINGNGNVSLSNATTTADGVGITFPATQVLSSNANTLDDYEEGSWTPNLSGSSGGSYTMGGVNSGRYIKIGKMVWVTATVQWTGQTTAYSGNLWVTGLPFTSAGARAAGSMGAISYGLSFTAGYGEWNYLIDPGYTSVYIIQNSTSGAGYSHGPNVSTMGLVYALSIVYEAAG